MDCICGFRLIRINRDTYKGVEPRIKPDVMDVTDAKLTFICDIRGFCGFIRDSEPRIKTDVTDVTDAKLAFICDIRGFREFIRDAKKLPLTS